MTGASGMAMALLLAMQSQAFSAQDWSRVIALRPGDQVVVTTSGSARLDAIFADASDERVRVLAVGSPAVADAIGTLLRASFTAADLAAAIDGRQLAAADVTLGPRGLTSRGALIATTANIVREIERRHVEEVRLRSSRRRASASGGLALIAAGTGMIVLNAIGLSSGTTLRPGEPRDGYLGVPGVVIGGALVITGGVLLGRAQPVIYRRR